MISSVSPPLSTGNGGVSASARISSVGDRELDLARREVGVHVLGIAPGHGPFHADHILGPERVGALVRLGRVLGMEDELKDARAVAHVDEDQPAVVAPAVHPAGHARLGVGAVGRQLAAPDVAVFVRPRRVLHSCASGAQNLGDHVGESGVVLIARLHVLQPGRTVLADDRHVAGADPVGVPELALQRPAGELELRLEPGAARLNRQLERRARALAIADRDVQVDELGRGRELARRQQYPLDPRRPARGRGRGPVEQLDQAVVAPAAAHAGLCPELVAGELEHRACVVIQPAHQGRVELVAQPGIVEQRADAREVLGVLGIEPVQELRRVAHNRLCTPVAGVERSHRVQVDAIAHVLGELLLVRAQERLQLLPVLRAGGRSAQARQPQPGALDPGGLEQVGQEDDQLSVGLRRVGADRLGAELPELPVAAPLRRLGAEAARQVPELHGLGQLAHPVLEIGPADRRGDLRAKRQRAAAAIVERVHLLLHDVGGLPHPAREQLGRLERRRLDPAVAGGAEDLVRLLLEDLPPRRRFREDVECAARGLNHRTLTAPRARAGTGWWRARARAS